MSNIELLADSRAEAINGGGAPKIKVTNSKIAIQTNSISMDNSSQSAGGNMYISMTNTSTIS
jgi:hypothetical protein